MGTAVHPGALSTKEVELGELGDSLGFLLRISQVRVFNLFYARFGEDGLRPGEFSVLWLIHKNPRIKQGLVGLTLRIKPAHMTKTVRRLEDQGLLKREIPNDDRRTVLLTLTQQGKAFVESNRESFFGSDAYLTHSLTSKETSALARLLRRFAGLEEEE